MDFSGKSVIVTGAGKGIGRATALLLAKRGASVVALTRTAADLDSLQKEIGCVSIAVDLADADATRAAAIKALPADFLVNCAGTTELESFLDLTVENFDLLHAVNTRAPMIVAQEVVRALIAQGLPGAIVNVSSIAAQVGTPLHTAYCASKGALDTLTRNTAFALLKNRIRVNGLNIGWMSSDGEDRIQREFHGAAEDWLDKAAAAQPFGRLVDPAEVARAVAYLSSAESGLMTGSTINFDQSIWGAYDGSPHPVAPM